MSTRFRPETRSPLPQESPIVSKGEVGLAITRTKKESLVAEYTDLLKSSSALVFTDYRGSTVAQIQAVRNKLREQNTPYMVVKNSLLHLAMTNAEIPLAEDQSLDGPMAVAFVGEDIGRSVTALKDAIKDLEHVTIVGGLMEGKLLGQDAAVELANLPTREAILASLVAMINAPATNLARILGAPSASLARVINAHAEKEQEAA